MTRPVPDPTHLAYLATIMPDGRLQVNPLTWCGAPQCCARQLPVWRGGKGCFDGPDDSTNRIRISAELN